MIHTADTVRILRVIAGVLALALFLWSTSFPGLLHKAEADDIINASDTLSDSTPSAPSNHTFQFTLPNGMASGDTITITFPGTFGSIATLGAEDIDLATTTDETIQDGAAGVGAWGLAVGATTVALTTPTNYGVASSTAITIEIGTHATSGATGDTQITNPSATTTSYGIDIDTAWDSGQVRVAVVDNVAVTASVNTSLTFTVQGTTTGTTINGSATTTAADSSATTLPFGTLVQDVSKVLGQDLFVETNAGSGFVVTVESTEPFDSSTGADIDTFSNGTDVTSPSAWVAPSGTLGSEETYGHWGVTSDDDDFSGTQDRWIAASTTPRAIFTHNGPADGATADIGWTTVGYQAQITALQEASTDYDTYLIYIATPTF